MSCTCFVNLTSSYCWSGLHRPEQFSTQDYAKRPKVARCWRLSASNTSKVILLSISCPCRHSHHCSCRSLCSACWSSSLSDAWSWNVNCKETSYRNGKSLMVLPIIERVISVAIFHWCEPNQSICVHVNAKRIHRRDEHVQPKIKLAAINE